MIRSHFVVASLVSAFLVSATSFAQTVKKPISRTKPAAKAAPSVKTSATALTSQNDSISYSVGVSVAQSLKQQGLNSVNTAALARGLSEALKGEKMAISMEQAQQVIQSYMQKQYAIRQTESKKAGEGNRKIGAAFLAENKTKAGVVTTASGLQYQVLTEGKGAKPTANDKVKVHYTGKLLDGKVFDSSVERGQPAEFPVTGVIPGWVEALQLMPVGSKWQLFIPADLAYGDRGAGSDIAPGSTLVFEVELLDIVK